MIVIADTSPLNYLVLIDCVEVLPRLYGRVIVPKAVVDELCEDKAPPAVRQWISSAPEWLEVKGAVGPQDAALRRLGLGEREAVVLAEELHADSIILDDLPGRREAKRRPLHVIGTLTILYEAAEGGHLDFPAAVEKLVGAGFHASPALVRLFLDLHAHRLGGKN